MLENPNWFLRDIEKRRVIVMYDRHAVQILHRSPIGSDNITVREVRSGKIHTVHISKLYEPSSGSDWRADAPPVTLAPFDRAAMDEWNAYLSQGPA